DVSDWRGAIDDLGLPVPAGVTPDAFARSLALSAVASFPNAALLGRVNRVPADTAARLETLQPLLRLNDGVNVLTQPFDSLKTDRLAAESVAAMRDAYDALRETANLNPGLGLHQVLSVPGDASATLAAMNGRIAWMTTFEKLNPNVDFLDADLTPDS